MIKLPILGPAAAAFVVAALTLLGCSRTPEQKAAKFLANGNAQFQKKDYARAIIEFRNAARLQPKSAEPLYQTALVYSAMNDSQNAYAFLRRATELDPKHLKAQSKLGEMIGGSIAATRDLEQLLAAEKQVHSILATIPDNADALGALGLTEYLLGKPEDGIAHLRTALEKVPQNLQAARDLAFIKLSQKDFTGAEEVLRQAAAASPNSPEAHVALARLFMTTLKTSDAEVSYRQALKIDPKYGPALLDLAKLELSTGRKDEGEKTLQALSALPDKAYRPLHGAYLFQVGRADDAIREFQQQAAADPGDREAFTRLISAYFYTKRLPEAEQAISAALKRNSHDTSALIERSRLNLLTSKYSEAEADLNQVIKSDPGSAPAHYLLSRVYLARGQDLLRREQLSGALQTDPSLMAARLELAQMLTAAKDSKTALELLNRSPDSQKNLLPVLMAKNWALFGLSNSAELRKNLDADLAAFPQSPDLWMQDGVLRFQLKDVSGARKSFGRVIALQPEQAAAVDALAKTFLAEKQPERALQVVEQHARERPHSAALQNLWGNWLAANNRRPEARKAFTAALSSDPNLVAARMSLAFEDIEDGNFDAARASLEVLAKVPATSARAEVTLGILEEKAGNPAQAMGHYRKTLESDANNVSALNNLAYLLADGTDRFDEALKYAQQAKQLQPNSLAIDDTLGWAFYRKGLYANAVSYLKNAVAKEATARRKYHLAMAYLKSGDQEHGKQTLQEARRMNPALPESAAAEALLGTVQRN